MALRLDNVEEDFPEFEWLYQEALIVHEIALRLYDEGLWDSLDDDVRNAYEQNAINFGLTFYLIVHIR